MRPLLLALCMALISASSVQAEASKSPLYDSPTFTCPGGASETSGPTFGFVVINPNGSGDLNVEVSVKDGTPNSTYDVWVNQYPGGCPLAAPTAPGAVRTNRQGNGNSHVRVAAIQGTQASWVSVIGGGQTLRSTAPLALAPTPAPQWFPLDPSRPPGTPAALRFDPTASSPSESFFDVFIPGFWYQLRTGPSGEPFTELSFPGLTQDGPPGAPKLPLATAVLAVPPDAASATLAGSPEYMSLHSIQVPNPLWPNPIPEVDDPIGTPEQFVPPDPSIYGGGSPWPVGDGDLRQSPRRMGGAVLGCKFQLFPVHWNPADGLLSVPLLVRYQIQHPGQLTSPPITKDTALYSTRRFLNWSAALTLYPLNLVSFTADFLILTPATYESALQSFVTQKAARGFDVQVATIPSSGNTCASIRTLIEYWYAGTPSWHDHYCLLVGDTSVIPFCDWSGTPTDDLYGDADGDGIDDADEEVYVGRLSADGASDVDNQTAKWLRYEDRPNPFFNYGRDLLVAHRQGAPGKYEGAQESVANYGDYTVQPVFTKVYGSVAGNTNATVSSQIEDGHGIICYRGHGDTSIWWSWNQSNESYRSTDVDSLENNIAPVVWSFACTNYDADAEDCIAEHWLERELNHGGVAHYGATIPSGTNQNHALDRLMHKAVFEHGFTKQGRTIEWAEEQLADSLGSGNDRMYGLLGDPDMDIRRSARLQLDLLRPEFVPLCPYGCEYRLRLASGIEGALIGIFKPGQSELPQVHAGSRAVVAESEVFDNKYTDPNGEVVLQGAPATPGWMYVAVRYDGGQGGDAILDSILVEEGPVARRVTGSLTLTAAPGVTRSGTSLRFGRALDRALEMRVYDVAGRVLRTLHVPQQASSVIWDGRDASGRRVACGVYFARLADGDRELTARVVVVR